VLRLEAYFRPFHVAGSLEYVASGAYRTEPSLQRFLQSKADRMRRGGETVVLSLLSLRQTCIRRSFLSRAVRRNALNFSCEARAWASKSAAIPHKLRFKRTDTGSAIRAPAGEADGPLSSQKYAGLAP